MKYALSSWKKDKIISILVSIKILQIILQIEAYINNDDDSKEMLKMFISKIVKLVDQLYMFWLLQVDCNPKFLAIIQ